MATARENQGYLIAIILMVLLIVVLAILTYFAFTQAGAATSKLEDTNKTLAVANSQAIAYEEQAAILKAYLGIEPFTVGEVGQRMKKIESTAANEVFTKTVNIKNQFEADMARYIRPTGEGVEKTYRGLVTDMSTTLMASHRIRVAQNASIDVAEEEKKEAIARKDEQIKGIQEQLDAKSKALAAEQSNHNQTKNTLDQQLANAKDAVRQVNEVLEQSRFTWNTQRQSLTTTRDEAVGKVSGLEKKLAKYESKRFESSDGKVIRVSNEIDRVYVDIGSADRLQLRQSFSVFDQNEDTFERGREKAKIEIFKITGPHAAEARIVDSSAVDPILPGDNVVTPTWDRGYSVPVALAGFFDLDGDGRSDLDRVASMIRQNGGEVVAFNDENGKVIGKIDEDTRYLVVGQDPTETAQIQAMSILEKQAKAFVVQRIPVREYLSWMGLRIESNILEGTGTIHRGTRFPTRQPPANKSSAFGDN